MNWADYKHIPNSVNSPEGDNTEPSQCSRHEGVETRRDALIQITCRKCHKPKPETEYYSRNGTKRRTCKECRRDLERERIYGVSRGEFWDIYHKQNGRCGICDKRMHSERWKGFAIDHCHTTKKVRGLLCTQCNVGLGNFMDDPARLLKAAAYLKV